MNPDELNKILGEQADKIIQMHNASLYWQHIAGRPSPTGTNARGRYEYQRPEQDEQGTLYGYKILHKHCDHSDCDVFISPRYSAQWIDGELEADGPISERSMRGIHFTKRADHPELRQYCGPFHGSAYYLESKPMWVLVKCALSGDVIETEQGFRAQYATIIGVYEDGNWKSYQDYQERAKANPCQNPWKET